LLVDAQIAQLVEQRIENPRVLGSIPSLGTIILEALQEIAGLFSFCHIEIENPRVLAGNRKLRLRVWAPLFYKLWKIRRKQKQTN
jgi:hypothetical protein